MLDKEDNQTKIFSYETTTSEFRTSSGTKKFFVNDSNYEPLGTL
jgi:hypothetical protein